MKMIRVIAGLMLWASVVAPVLGDWSAAHTAVEEGDAGKLSNLLSKHPDLVDTKDCGDHTPLHLAAFDGRKGAVEVLLAHGAAINAPDVCGWTALHTAVVRHHKDVVELLLAKGADINAKDRQGQTALHLAVKYHVPDVAEYLRQHGARE
jgi:ankyrin repeat protein